MYHLFQGRQQLTFEDKADFELLQASHVSFIVFLKEEAKCLLPAGAKKGDAFQPLWVRLI